MGAKATTILTLVRHGETPANVEGVWHGSIDTELTDRGRVQASRVAEHVAATRTDVRAIYASPLQRARHTAAAIAERLVLDVAVEDDLREYHLGAWEGLPYSLLTAEHRLFERMHADPDWEPGGGESARGVALRLAGCLERLAERHAGERIVVVSHGGALTLALGWLVDGDPSTWRRVMGNCAVTDLELGAKASLLAFNESAHLEDLP
jgi:probable phosphoglycerate mutase